MCGVEGWFTNHSGVQGSGTGLMSGPCTGGYKSEDRAFQDFSWIQGCRPLDLREVIAFLSYIYISRN